MLTGLKKRKGRQNPRVQQSVPLGKRRLTCTTRIDDFATLEIRSRQIQACKQAAKQASTVTAPFQIFFLFLSVTLPCRKMQDFIFEW